MAVFDSYGIELLDKQPGFWSPAEGKKITETWLAQYGDEIDGIWSGGAQMSQGMISAYVDAEMEIPPIAGGEWQNGFLRLALEHGFEFYAWMYPNAMITICIDAAIQILQGEPIPRFIDFHRPDPSPSLHRCRGRGLLHTEMERRRAWTRSPCRMRNWRSLAFLLKKSKESAGI